MRVSTLIASAVLFAFLAGCAATHQVVWSKAGVTTAQGEKDLQDCADKANMIYATSPEDGRLNTGYITDQQVLKDNFSKCMESKGYKYAGTQPIAQP